MEATRPLTSGCPDGKSIGFIVGSRTATLSVPTITPERSLKFAPYKTKGLGTTGVIKFQLINIKDHIFPTFL